MTTTSAGPIATRAVVNAAGPWAGQVAAMAGVMLPVVPERRHIFIAQPAPGASWDDAAYAGRTPSSRLMVIDFDTTFYFHREGAGLLFGMGDAASGRASTPPCGGTSCPRSPRRRCGACRRWPRRR